MGNFTADTKAGGGMMKDGGGDEEVESQDRVKYRLPRGIEGQCIGFLSRRRVTACIVLVQ